MDTFVFVFPIDTYLITDYKRFKDYFEPIDPNNFAQKMDFISRHASNRKYIQNPSASLRSSGLVYPNLTIYERYRFKKYTCDLHVSISLSKLLNGHSFYDIFDEDRTKIIQLLINRLAYMGVKVSEENVLNAIIQTIHYSINILFRSEEEARIFLERINKGLV